MSQFYLQRVLRSFVLIAMISPLGACGQGQLGQALDSDESRSAAPLETRAHRYFSSKASSSASLGLRSAFPEIVQLSTLAESELAARILYDSRFMPRLAKPEAISLLHSWLATYGQLVEASSQDEWMALPPRDIDERHQIYSYQRFIQGIPVRDNILQLILSKPADEASWYLGEVVSNCSGALDSLHQDSEPALRDEKLFAHDSFADYQVLEKKREWLSFPSGKGFSHELATVFSLHNADEDDFVATLLHSNLRILEHYPLSLHMQSKGVQARALKRSYLDAGPREYPLAFATVSSSGGSLELGAEAWLPQGMQPQVVTLSGSRANLVDADGSTPNLTRLQNQPDAFILANQSYEFASVNAFVAVQRINRFVRQFMSGSEVPFLNSPLKIATNSADGSCNAYYSPRLERILLYREGNDCANMSLINDVVFHEWGHALDDHTGLKGGIADYAFSEGIADTLAAFHNDDPDIAPGFFFNDPTPVRSILNTRRYPRDQSPTTHFEGGIISGAFWDLRLSLVERYGKRRGAYYAAYLFMRHLLTVDSYVDSYAAVLRLDDDDGKAETPSPNSCLIQKAFALHGLAPESPCADTVASVTAASKAVVDEDLALALWEIGETEDGVRLVASSLAGEQLAYCWGESASCMKNPAARVALDLLSKQAQRKFFASNVLQLPSELQTLTLLRLDGKGEILGSRAFVIHAK